MRNNNKNQNGGLKKNKSVKSHGVCEKCFKKFYPKIYKKVRGK
jgi:hypothetical protein